MTIRTRRDLAAAITALAGRTGNDRATRDERREVARRARMLGAAALIPAEWNPSTGRHTPARNARR